MPRKPSEILTQREYEVMNAVWELEEASIYRIWETLGKNQAGAYTSVASVLRNLEQKNLVSHQNRSNTYYYRAEKSREEVQQEILQYVLRTFYRRDKRRLLRQLNVYDFAEAME